MQSETKSTGKIALIGIPCDSNSSYMKGASSAPDLIRKSYFCDSSNLTSEGGVDLDGNSSISDMGNIDLADDSNGFSEILQCMDDVVDKGFMPVSLGGDHSITYPIVYSLYRHFGPINILHFDAHPDLYENFNDNQYSHASPFARVMEAGYAKRLVQVGIRTLNHHQKEQVDRYGIDLHEMKDLDVSKIGKDFDGPVYISIDLDALDPAFAPGVSHHEPGGLSTREMLTVIQNIPNKIIGADIVEYNPERDINGVTSMVAAKLLKEVFGKILSIS